MCWKNNNKTIVYNTYLTLILIETYHENCISEFIVKFVIIKFKTSYAYYIYYTFNIYDVVL